MGCTHYHGLKFFFRQEGEVSASDNDEPTGRRPRLVQSVKAVVADSSMGL